MHLSQEDSLQLIDGSGNFNESGLESFVRAVKLSDCGLSYAVVSIMGPQSSGKSTLLNHLFGTRFREMDAFKGRAQTTQGVWLATAKGITPCTLVLDLEGTDGRERGEDDTTFEKQSSLFALAVSDVVLINMWCHDIGREHAANKPLLKTVFQVMMRLFTPRRTTLLFVIRDKTKTPLETLEPILREDVQRIWESAPKPSKYKDSTLADFFQVEVTALASFEDREELFKEQVGQLRQRFINSIAPGGLAGDRTAVIPGSGFPLSSREFWKVIKENKDLDLPAHKVMVATVRCEEIARDKFIALCADEEWKDLSESATGGPVFNFGKRLSALLDTYLGGYDAEASHFESGVRDSKREALVRKCLELVQPCYQAVLGHHRARSFAKLKADLELSLGSSEREEGFAALVRRCAAECLCRFDQGAADASVPIAGWDPVKVREKLQRDIENHASGVKAQKLAAVVEKFERRLEGTLTASADSLLDAASSETWPSLRKLLSMETDNAVACLREGIAEFELDRGETEKLVNAYTSFARSVVEKKAREEASKALIRMKDRFNTVFSHDADLMPRVWSGDDDIRAITRDARASALKLLSVLSVVRLEDESDNVESVLLSLLGDNPENVQAADTRSITTFASSALAANTWDGVDAGKSLLSPVDCRTIWRQFKAETEYTISQALAAQEAKRRGASWLPPPWAIVAMVVLGFNEFMALVRNPLYLAIAFVIYLFSRAVWVQLDIGREFQNGMISGTLSVLAKLLPAIRDFLAKLMNEGQRLTAADEGSSNSGRVYREVPMREFGVSSSSSDGADAHARRRQQQQQVYA